MAVDQECKSSRDVTTMTLDLRSVVILLGIVASGAASIVWNQFQMRWEMAEQVAALDARWVDRVTQMEQRIRTEVAEVRTGIPSEVKLRLELMTATQEAMAQRIALLEKSLRAEKSANDSGR